MVERACKGCGTVFDAKYPSSQRFWCSATCRAAHRKGRSDAGKRKSDWVTVTCPCGKAFEAPPWMAEQRSYCSKPCVGRYAKPGRNSQPGKYTFSADGYPLIYLSPDQRPAGVRGSRYAEHRYVMMQRLGRDLLPGENVHHVNGVKTDNRPENLELWVTSQPKGQRVEDALAWAREIIQRYEGAAMPNHYVEDYEQLTGLTKDVTVPDEAAAKPEEGQSDVTTKVVYAPPTPQIRPAMSKAETK